MLCTENKQTRGRSQTHKSSNEALCDNVMLGIQCILRKQFQRRWCRNRRPASVCYLLSSVSMTKLELLEGQRPRGSILHTGTLFLFLVRGIWFIASCVEKHLFFDSSICIQALRQSFIWINILILEIFE